MVEPGPWALKAAALLEHIDDPDRRDDLQFQFEERAGIGEFCGGLPRDEAERLAFDELSNLLQPAEPAGVTA